MALSRRMPNSSEKSGLFIFLVQIFPEAESLKVVFKAIFSFLIREEKDSKSFLMKSFRLSSVRTMGSVVTSDFVKVRSFPFRSESFSTSSPTLSSQ